MKISSKVRTKEKVAMIAMALACSLGGGIGVEAANLVLTIPSDYGSSQMGVVTGSRVTSHVDEIPTPGVMTDLNRDPGLYGGFSIGGKSMLILRQYTYSTKNLAPIMIIDPKGNPAKPIASGEVKSAANPHGAASDGKYVFMTDYDLGTVAVARIKGERLMEEAGMTLSAENLFDDLAKGFDEGKAPFKYDVSREALHAEGALVDNGHLLVACNINVAATGWREYEDGVLFDYEITEEGLKFKGAAKIPRNCDSVRINKYNDHYILNGIGGAQMVEGNETAIGIASFQASKGVTHPDVAGRFATLPSGVEADMRDTKVNFYNSKVTPDGQAYLLAYELGAGNIPIYRVYKTTVSNLCADNPIDWEKIIDTNSEEGWFGRIDYDYYTKRLWTERGSYLEVYTDGETKPTHSWQARDFATNEEMYQFNSVALVPGDKVFGKLAAITETAPREIDLYQNAKEKKADSAVRYSEVITGSTSEEAYKAVTNDHSQYSFKNDIEIVRDTGIGDLETNTYAAVMARNGNDITLDTDKHGLVMRLANDIGSPTGIYVGNGKKVTIKAQNIEITTIVDADSGNSISHGIWNDAAKHKESTIDITGNVTLSLEGGYGGHGVAVDKLARWGEKTNESSVESQIHIRGDLTIKGKEKGEWGIGVNPDNVFSRFNSSGIMTTVDKSVIQVDGMVDLAIYGNGITTRGENSKVAIGGGRIEVPQGMGYSYYTLGAYAGTINVNTGKDGTVAGKNMVQLAGDIFVMKPGTVNVALVGKNSYLQGVIDSGGVVNLILSQGATWFNQKQNNRYEEDNEDIGFGGKSHVSKLTGGDTLVEAGIIQQQDSNDITIDKYSGHTIFLYGHEEKEPRHIMGGNITIGQAEKGSGIIIRTDSKGLNTDSDKEEDKKLVDDTLTYLANKLFYTAYATGERNLTGYVEIVEGLTTPAVSRRIENIKFKKNGQGKYLDTPGGTPRPGEEPNPGDNPSIKPDAQGKTPETLMMNVGKNAMGLASAGWISRMSGASQRMGDIRKNEKESGLWARYIGGENRWKPNLTDATQQYSIGQIGYDTKLNGWIVGCAFDYGTTKDTYRAFDPKKFSTAGGDGKENQYGLSLYAEKIYANGQYIDFIVKGTQINSHYTLHNVFGKNISADYDIQGYALSGEYGRTIKMGHGFYMKPDIRITVGHGGAIDYTASSTFDGVDELDIHQDAFSTAGGAIGLEIGHENNRGNTFVKISLNKELKGDITSTFKEEGKRKAHPTELSLKDTWIEMEMGGNQTLGDDGYIYATIAKSFGAVFKKDWRIDTGIRLRF